MTPFAGLLHFSVGRQLSSRTIFQLNSACAPLRHAPRQPTGPLPLARPPPPVARLSRPPRPPRPALPPASGPASPALLPSCAWRAPAPAEPEESICLPRRSSFRHLKSPAATAFRIIFHQSRSSSSVWPYVASASFIRRQARAKACRAARHCFHLTFVSSFHHSVSLSSSVWPCLVSALFIVCVARARPAGVHEHDTPYISGL